MENRSKAITVKVRVLQLHETQGFHKNLKKQSSKFSARMKLRAKIFLKVSQIISIF